MNVHLPKWLAIELVCRIICKYKKTVFNPDDFKDVDKLKSFLEDHKSVPFSEAVAEDAFKSRKQISKHQQTVRHAKAFHSLISAVRLEREVEMRKETFKKFKDYIGVRQFGDGVIIERKQILINRKRVELQGKKFEFFYYFNFPEKFLSGVCNGMLHFQLSTVVLSIYDKLSKVTIDYEGDYDVHKVSYGYVLQLNFSMGDVFEAEKPKLVNFTIPFPETETPCAFGVMYQTNPEFACINIILKQTQISSLDDNIVVVHGNNSNELDIGNGISILWWDFFNSYRTSFIEEMPVFSDEQELSSFLDRKLQEHKENIYQPNEVKDVLRRLEAFKSNLIKELESVDMFNSEKIIDHLEAIIFAYEFANLERGRNPDWRTRKDFSSWFDTYFTSKYQEKYG